MFSAIIAQQVSRIFISSDFICRLSHQFAAGLTNAPPRWRTIPPPDYYGYRTRSPKRALSDSSMNRMTWQ
jgi:hypothetical protein